ncbi:hypothetical protein C8R43DRAFT_984555 [Mycena crocata]|nr:hypothetical protein C8R43DRAFT_984555 [Mycena crocata]
MKPSTSLSFRAMFDTEIRQENTIFRHTSPFTHHRMEPTPQPVAHRSTDVWFDDGTVILQAEQTLFRVYRGVLAAQSTIFRDMFSISQPDAHCRKHTTDAPSLSSMTLPTT